MMYSIAPIMGLDTPVEYVQLEYQGYEVLAYRSPEGYILERLITTDPKAYLNSALQPGNLLENGQIGQVIVPSFK